VITVIPSSSSFTYKPGHIARLTIHPLSLHQLAHELTQEEMNRPKITMQVSSSNPTSSQFNAYLIHDWISLCIPNVPPMLNESSSSSSLESKNNSGRDHQGWNEEENLFNQSSSKSSANEEKKQGSSSSSSSSNKKRLHFRNTFTSTTLSIEYSNSSGLKVVADSPSPIAILKVLKKFVLIFPSFLNVDHYRNLFIRNLRKGGWIYNFHLISQLLLHLPSPLPNHQIQPNPSNNHHHLTSPKIKMVAWGV